MEKDREETWRKNESTLRKGRERRRERREERGRRDRQAESGV